MNIKVPITTTKIIDNSDSLWDSDEGDSVIDNKLRECPLINVEVGELNFIALIDSGANISAISMDAYLKLKYSNPRLPEFPIKKLIVIGANKSKSEVVNKQIMVDLMINDVNCSVLLVVVSNLLYEIILGVDFLTERQASIDFANQEINLLMNEYDSQKVNVSSKIKDITDSKMNVLNCPEIAEDAETELEMNINSKVAKCTDLNMEQKQKLKDLLIEFKTVFKRSGEPIVDYSFRIELNDTTPFKQKVYPVPQKFKSEVDKLIQEMIHDGIIEKCTTAYVNPLVIVRKKTNDVRICLDARLLNSKTIPFSSIPPKVDETLLKFSGKKYFTSTDFRSAYYQIKIREEDRKYTGFLYNGISYVFNRMPFGLKNSGSALIERMEEVIVQVMGDEIVIYLDDLVIGSEDFDSHLETLRKLFTILLQNNIRLNIAKSDFCKQEIKFLGHIVSSKGITMDPSKINIIENIAIPKNKKELRGFIGACQYYSRFCRNYALIIQPLCKLLRKNVKFSWNEQCQRVFEEVKSLFYQTCTISYPNYDLEMYVQTDASDVGVGAILFQRINGEDKVIQLVSVAFKGAELYYSTTEKEAYAIVIALKKLKYFLLGRHFIILTDHKALVFLIRSFLLHDRMVRWLTWLQQFDFTINHIEGSKNYLPDVLSRQQKCEGRIHLKPMIAAIDFRIELMPEITWEYVRLKQNEDNHIQSIKTYLMGQMDEQSTEYRYFHNLKDRWKLENNVVLIRIQKNPNIYRILWPKEDVRQLVMYVHTSYAHYGASKIFRILNEYVYWKNMFRDIRKILAKCDICLRTKYPNRHFQGKMHNIIPVSKNDLLAMDLYGPLPRAVRGNKFILVIINVFTKFTQIYPINKPNAVSCLKRLEEYLALIGPVKRIITDNGTQFQSLRWRNELRLKNIKPIYSSIRYPMSNPSERVMSQLSRLFRVYCNTNHRTWVELIPHINEWLNSVPHDTIGVSPFEAQFSRKPVGVLSKLEHPEIRRKNAISYRIILDNLKKSGKSRINKSKALVYNFKENQKVLVRVPRVSHPELGQFSKFFPLFEGPYIIRKIRKPNVCDLMREDGSNVGSYNFYNLRPYPE